MSSITEDISIEQLAKNVKLTFKTTGVDMPNEVFVIEVLPKSRDPKNVNYRFSHVANLTELIELPPEEDPEMCYFRTSEITMLFDTTDIAIKTKNALHEDITELVTLYNQLQELNTQV